MQFSHSRVETFVGCPRKFKMRYIDGIQMIPDDAPDNALYLGTALHRGIELSTETAIEEYYANYPIITDEQITEAMKLEVMIEKAKAYCPTGMHEVLIFDRDFKGFIDLLVPVGESGGMKYFDIYDFKYSNNVERYKESDQLHLYKYYFEKAHPDSTIRNLYFLIVPKSSVKQIKGESLQSYRQRVELDVNHLEPKLIPIQYDPQKVIDFLTSGKRLLEETEYPMHTGFLCRYCEYYTLCQKGEDTMVLPKNERRQLNAATKKVIWLYGSPFSGKTYFANKFPDPLMLNTDGNIKFVDAPFLAIKDDVHKEGRMTVRKSAWEVFKDAVAELELKDNDFKTIVVDLLEDTYEYCRKDICEKKGWTHESDDSFRAWDMVRTEFLNTIKRLMALDYENIILISHLDSSSDLTRKGGDKITKIKPNIQDKIANKVAGMVDIVARTICEDDTYTMNFKRSEVIFGGGRLNFKNAEIPLDYDSFCKLYDTSVSSNAEKVHCEDTATSRNRRKTTQNPVEQTDSVPTENVSSESDMPVPVKDLGVLEGTTYIKTPDGNFLKKQAGTPVAELPEGFEIITEAEFNEGVKAYATQETPPVRRRRARTDV